MASRDDELKPRNQKSNKGNSSGRPRKRKQKGGMSPLAIVGIVFGCLFLGCIICSGVAFVALPEITKFPSTASSQNSKNNLKFIGLAMHNYHDVHRTFPPGGTFDVGTGKYHHSWMTMLLPFTDQVHLYNRIDFDEPWDSIDNGLVFENSVPTFLASNIGNDRVDIYGASHYAANKNLFSQNSQIKIRDIIDGTRNTIMAGEVSDNIMAWGNPENVRDPANGVTGGANAFGSFMTKEGAMMLFADGSVRRISNKIHPGTLKALSTPAKGDIPGEF